MKSVESMLKDIHTWLGEKGCSIEVYETMPHEDT